MSFIFSSEWCEHKESKVWPWMGLLAFNRLHIPFYAPILSPPSTWPPFPTHHPYYYHIQYHYQHEKAAQTAQILSVWKLFTHKITANEYTSTCCKFHFFSIIHQEAIIQILLKIVISPSISLCVEAGFCRIQLWFYVLSSWRYLLNKMQSHNHFLCKEITVLATSTCTKLQPV